MARPTIKNIVEIIEKLKTLKEKLSDFINEKCNTSPDKADEKVHTIDDEVDKAVRIITGRPVSESIDPQNDTEKLSAEQLLRSLLDFDSTSLKESRQNTPSEKLLKFVGMHPKELFENKLKKLPIDELERLLNEVIPRLLADNKILSTQKRHLHQIENSVSRELKQKEKFKGGMAKIIETANRAELLKMQREGSWPEDIKRLMNEIIVSLFPYLDYLEEKGTSGKWEQASIEYFIKTGKPSNLDDVSQELEKIKYKIKVESQQSAAKKPTGTEQDITRAKCRRIVKKISGWIFKKTSHFIFAIIVAVVVAVIAAIVVDALAEFGWLERIKDFIYDILQINRDNVQ